MVMKKYLHPCTASRIAIACIIVKMYINIILALRLELVLAYQTAGD